MPRDQPPGEEAIRYDHPVEVGGADIDRNGHANNVVYLRWVQDAAVAHWRAVVGGASGAGFTWVVVRHEVDYKRPAFAGDRLVVRTWIGAMGAVTSERFTDLIRPGDGQSVAKARTIWCVVDPSSGRPKRIDPSYRALFFRPA